MYKDVDIPVPEVTQEEIDAQTPGWSTPIAYAHFRDSFPFTGSLLVVELRSDPASQLRRTNYADPGDAKSQPSAVKRE